jgi:hypothetical protein
LEQENKPATTLPGICLTKVIGVAIERQALEWKEWGSHDIFRMLYVKAHISRQMPSVLFYWLQHEEEVVQIARFLNQPASRYITAAYEEQVLKSKQQCSGGGGERRAW